MEAVSYNSNNSNSEIISPENNYKFDYYGIVMADSIEDLLYDKYHHRNKHKFNKSNKNNDSYELIENGNEYKLNSSNGPVYKKNELNNKHINIKSATKNNNSKTILKNFANIENNNNKLKMIKNKGFQINNNSINKKRNKIIKIILNINNKEIKEFEINPNDNNPIKNLDIYKKYIYKFGNNSKPTGNSDGNNLKIINESSNNNKNLFRTNMFLKFKEHEKNKDSIEKVQIIPSSQRNNKNNDEKVDKKTTHKILNIFRRQRKNNHIKLIPNLSKCYFKKENKTVIVRTHIPLQNVINNNYFWTKEIKRLKNKSPKKVYIRKLKNKTKKNKIKNKTNYLKSLDNKINKVKTKKGENISPELDFNKNRNFPTKIINPLNSSYKYGKVSLKKYLSNKSKSCQKIIYNCLENYLNKNKKSYLINRIKKNNKNNIPINNSNINEIQNITNNRYENKKEFPDIYLLKNKEIVSALSNNSNSKIICQDYKTLNKNKTNYKAIFRNSILKSNKNISKSEKNIQMNPIKPKYNIKNKLLYFQNEEEKIENKMLKKFNLYNIFQKQNKILYDNRNIGLKQQNNKTYNSDYKYSSQTHFEFPAIDSYFY